MGIFRGTESGTNGPAIWDQRCHILVRDVLHKYARVGRFVGGNRPPSPLELYHRIRDAHVHCASRKSLSIEQTRRNSSGYYPAQDWAVTFPRMAERHT